MFKKLFLILCLLALCITVSSGGITDKLKSVIARKNVAGGGESYTLRVDINDPGNSNKK